MAPDVGPRRIRLISHSYADDDNTNAQNLTVREIARRLDPDLFEMTVFASAAPDARLVSHRNVRIERFGRHGKAAKFLRLSLLGGFDANFLVRNDWVDALYLRARPILAPRQVALYHVVGVVGDRADNPRDFDAFARGITRSQVVTCNSRCVADSVEARFGLRAPVIRNGVDLERFHPPGRTRSRLRPRILFAGSLQERKRPDLVLEVAARTPGADFRLVGSGPLRDALDGRASSMANVTMLPAVPQARLAEEMREADVFLLSSASSTAEGAPQVLAQAAASGLPVVAFDAYRPEAVVDGETGFLVHDESELVHRVNLLVQRPELRVSMGEAGVRLARERFRWDDIVGEWQRLLLEACSRMERVR